MDPVTMALILGGTLGFGMLQNSKNKKEMRREQERQQFMSGMQSMMETKAMQQRTNAALGAAASRPTDLQPSFSSPGVQQSQGGQGMQASVLGNITSSGGNAGSF